MAFSDPLILKPAPCDLITAPGSTVNVCPIPTTTSQEIVCRKSAAQRSLFAIGPQWSRIDCVGVTVGGTGVFVGVAVAVAVGGSGVFVGVCVAVAVGGIGVFVGVAVGVAVGGTGVLVGVLVGVVVGGSDVFVGVDVGVAVGGSGVFVGVDVGVTVGGTGVFVGVAVDVAVGGSGVFVGVAVGVTVGGNGVFVGVAVGVDVGGSGVFVGVAVGVAVGGSGVLVGVLVGVAVGGSGVFVGVAVGIAVGGNGVAVGVAVGGNGVAVGVAVGGSGVFVTVGVGVGFASSTASTISSSVKRCPPRIATITYDPGVSNRWVISCPPASTTSRKPLAAGAPGTSGCGALASGVGAASGAASAAAMAGRCTTGRKICACWRRVMGSAARLAKRTCSPAVSRTWTWSKPPAPISTVATVVCAGGSKSAAAGGAGCTACAGAGGSSETENASTTIRWANLRRFMPHPPWGRCSQTMRKVIRRQEREQIANACGKYGKQGAAAPRQKVSKITFWGIVTRRRSDYK